MSFDFLQFYYCYYCYYGDIFKVWKESYTSL